MKAIQISHEWRDPARKEYDTDITNIRQAAAKYGRANDTVELWDDNETLVAIATWPQGSKVYRYCTSPDKRENPAAWKY